VAHLGVGETEAGFKRYVALAVLARNVLRLGQILYQHEQRHKRRSYKQAA
jgi:hypothetical protein